MAVGTSIRAGRATALLCAVQSAKGTIATNFANSSATRLWTESAFIDAGRKKSQPRWMMQTQCQDTNSRCSLPERPAGHFIVNATPASVEFMLRSNFGGYSSPTFTYASQVNEWLTLGWVEDTASGATQNFVRIKDAWVHTLGINVDALGKMTLRADYAGRSTAVQALDAGGITFPTVPMDPADVNIFAGRDVTFIRDPASANVSLSVHELKLTLSQGLDHRWDMMANLTDVHKSWKIHARVEFTSRVSAETWAILTNARAGTKQTFRMVATAPSPSKTLTINLYEMDFEVEPLGHEDREYVDFRAVGEAHKSGSNFVSITLA